MLFYWIRYLPHLLFSRHADVFLVCCQPMPKLQLFGIRTKEKIKNCHDNRFISQNKDEWGTIRTEWCLGKWPFCLVCMPGTLRKIHGRGNWCNTHDTCRNGMDCQVVFPPLPDSPCDKAVLCLSIWMKKIQMIVDEFCVIMIDVVVEAGRWPFSQDWT